MAEAGDKADNDDKKLINIDVAGINKIFDGLSTSDDQPMKEENIGEAELPIEPIVSSNEGVCDILQLRRFLCFGSEQGKCTVEDQKLTTDSAKCVTRLIDSGQGEEVVREIVAFSRTGRAVKQKAIIFALAICARLTPNRSNPNHVRTKRAAYKAMTSVCRIPTDMFLFQKLCRLLSDNGKGYGRAYRRAFSQWYTEKDALKLAHLTTKYKSREGWSHCDIIRQAHVKTSSEQEPMAAVIKYLLNGLAAAKKLYEKDTSDAQTKQVFAYLTAVQKIKGSHDIKEAVGLIREHQLMREHVPTWLYKEKQVWEALLGHMPLTALMKNLSKLALHGLMDEAAVHGTTKIIIDKISDKEAVKHARLHPISILTAINVYEKGKSLHSKDEWKTNAAVSAALHGAFNSCFENIAPTNKRFLVALDVTKSMLYGNVAGCRHLKPVHAAAALAMVTLRCEPRCDVISYSSDVRQLSLSPTAELSDVIQCINELPKGSADSSLPIRWAEEKKKEYDVIIIYTDNEPFLGAVKASDAIKQYRETMNIPDAKFVTCAITCKHFTLADPNDRNMMDIAGIDSNTISVIQQFVADII